MNIIFTILLVLAGILAFLLLLAFFMKREHHVKREIIILAPHKKVFDYIKLLKNQDMFNKGAMADPDRKREFRGTDGTVGFIYSWKGDKNAGEGEKEIKGIIEGKRIETEIRFVKPMIAVGHVVMETEPLSKSETKVHWSNTGVLNYPLNIMVPMVEKHVAQDMITSLSALKIILEK